MTGTYKASSKHLPDRVSNSARYPACHRGQALPGLAERREDIAPNLDYELDRFAEREGDRASFNKEARERYLAFATGPDAHWPGYFRDLAASVTRMTTLSPKGRIDMDCAEAEIRRLKHL